MIVSGRKMLKLGDSSDHGGKIITGDPNNLCSINGIPVARVGDLHACPQSYSSGSPHSITMIISTGSEPRGIVLGVPIALEGDKTMCGAQLIASQSISVSKK